MKDEINIKELLQINELNLDEELAGCSYLYFMFSDLAIDAELIHNKAELALENHELDLANKYKAVHKPKNNQDKLTETEIKRMYRGDEKWTLLKQEQMKCYANFKKLEKAAKAFEMKSQNCMSINKRQLFKAGQGMEEL